MLSDLKSNLTWHGIPAKAPGKYSQTDIQNKISSFQESDIKDQYNKFHIHDAPNINRMSFGRITDQPFIIRGIQQRDGDPEFYGTGGRTSPESGMIRGGLITFARRVAEDTVRFAKLLISPKGLIWNIKQFGLHASNPNVETNIGIRPTKVFDPLSFASNIITAGEGIHSARHGTFGIRGRYEDVQKDFIRSDAEGVYKNRLEKLRVELIGGESPHAEDQGTPTSLWGTIVQGISNIISPLQNLLAGFDGSEIKTISGPGGPKSVYGIGYTTIRRATTTGTGLKDNLGNGYWGLHYNIRGPYESSTIPGAVRTLEDRGAPGNSIEKTYNDERPHSNLLPIFDANTGGYGLLDVNNKFDTDGYLINNNPSGGRVYTTDQEDDLNRPKIISNSGKIDEAGNIITDLGQKKGEPYLESNSPAQNKSIEDSSPGGGRYVGTSYNASEETHTRSKNLSGKDLLESAEKYHIYQNRESDYPAGYYSLMNSNSGPRGKPTGPSVHNIFRTIEDEQTQVRTLVNGKKIYEHVHSFLYGTTDISTDIIKDINTGYNKNFLNNTPTDGGADWDTNPRTALYSKIDPSAASGPGNTPQIRDSAQKVFVPGSPTGYKGYLTLSPSSTGNLSLGGMAAGDKIFNYFTPDLRFFTGVTVDQFDNTSMITVLLEVAEEESSSNGEIYGSDSDPRLLSYNGIDFTPKYTQSNPKLGPSPAAGQISISGQLAKPIIEEDALIKTKLDPLINNNKPESAGIRTIGGKPNATAGTPVVYSYMNYQEIRNQESVVTNPKRINEFRKNVSSFIKNEISNRSLDKLGYGGAGQVDRLNATLPGESPPQEDIVPFYIAQLGGSKALYFRAGINSISDTFSPGWKQEAEIGRADPKIILEGWGRSFSLDLTMAAGSADELIPMWEKLNTLAGWTAPDYSSGNGYAGTFVELTLGDMYQQVPCYLSAFAISIDNETPWEITSGQRLPKYASVTLDLTYVGTELPQKGTKFFSATAGDPGSMVSSTGGGATGPITSPEKKSVGQKAMDIGKSIVKGYYNASKQIFSALNPFD